MLTIVFLTALFCSIEPSVEQQVLLRVNTSLHVEWRLYKQRYQKMYANFEDELNRRAAWEENLKFIEKHNRLFLKGRQSYKLGANKFADLTNADYRKTVLMPKIDLQISGFINENSSFVASKYVIDWRKKGYVTPVKDQGTCRSSWAFSATGSIEGQHFSNAGELVSLSEQTLIDCSSSHGNQGCSGGTVNQAFQYVIENQGIDARESYPYEAADGIKCKKRDVAAVISSYKDLPAGDEKALLEAVATVGPISAAIDAGQQSFQLYESGIYNEPNCTQTELNHFVLIVGCDIVGGKPLFIVKNSWGEGWGNKGYIWIGRQRKNQCGIATLASYPII